MSDAKQAWNDVEEKFGSWGKRVSDRYRERTTDGGSAEETQRKLEEAAREIGDQLTRAFSALGETLKDEEAKRDLKDAVGAIGQAVVATVNDAGEAIRRQVGRTETPAPGPRPDQEGADEPPPADA